MSATTFIKKVSGYIDAHSLLRHDAPVVVAVSGGADSVALLSVLVESGYDCTAAHCNFHLRGDESTRDMRHVERLADRLGVDLSVKDFDVPARRHLTGESLEMACRGLRYEWFAELLDRNRAQAVAVGHHAEDQVETFFLNLLRGSGLTGLCGMKPRHDNVVRPLLECERREIEGYLHDRGLEWVNDSTNASDIFSRNLLRNRLLPMFEELFPGAGKAIARTMCHLREADTFYREATNRAVAPHCSDNGDTDLMALATSPHAGLLLYEFLRDEGFNRTQTDDMLRAASHGTGAVFHAAGGHHSRCVDHGILRTACADTSDADAADISLLHDIIQPIHITISRHSTDGFKPEGNRHVIYIDARALEGSHHWQLRHWRRADRMKPFGMTGTRLVSDIFAQNRLSAAEKRSAWLLTRDDKIIWAVGLRASALFTVGPNTNEYLRLEYLP